MYQNAFEYNDVGYACAIAVVLAVVIFVRRVRRQPARRRGHDADDARRRTSASITYSVLVVFAIVVIYPILSILFLALHKQGPTSSRASRSRTARPAQLHRRWRGTAGGFSTGCQASFIVAATVTVVSAVLSIGTGYAFGTMRFRGDRWLF